MRTKQRFLRHSMLTLVFMFSCIGFTFAQDGSTSTTKVTTTTETVTNWYAQPWVWIAGGVVVLLILISLLRGGGSKTTVTKTTTTDTNIS